MSVGRCLNGVSCQFVHPASTGRLSAGQHPHPSHHTYVEDEIPEPAPSRPVKRNVICRHFQVLIFHKSSTTNVSSTKEEVKGVVLSIREMLFQVQIQPFGTRSKSPRVSKEKK